MLQRIDQPVDFAHLARVLLRGGHTTASLAKAVGLSQPSISRLTSGRTKTLNADAAIRLIELAGGRVSLPADQAKPASQEIRNAA